MKIRSTDTFTLPCGCLANEVRYFDEEGVEIDDVIEFEPTPTGARILERWETSPGIWRSQESFGTFHAVCRHSAPRPYLNGHMTEMEG
jgi:hypothetical protein